MKKFILIIFIFLTCLVIPSLWAITKSNNVDDRLAIHTIFKMDIFDDGVITDQKMLVDLKIIEQDSGDFYVEWNDVYIQPYHENKSVILKPEHNSTLDGSINNVTVTKTGFSFVIDLSRQLFGEGRTLQIVGTKKGERSIFGRYDVKGSGLWWSELLKKSIKREFKSTDKKIILPYKEVFCIDSQL